MEIGEINISRCAKNLRFHFDGEQGCIKFTSVFVFPCFFFCLNLFAPEPHLGQKAATRPNCKLLCGKFQLFQAVTSRKTALLASKHIFRQNSLGASGLSKVTIFFSFLKNALFSTDKTTKSGHLMPIRVLKRSIEC